uniref:Ovule protein n=1 Tax=Heterorhabditis bacteriophora TaxID=37862 RepID=A0A1I7XDE5_HETBA
MFPKPHDSVRSDLIRPLSKPAVKTPRIHPLVCLPDPVFMTNNLHSYDGKLRISQNHNEATCGNARKQRSICIESPHYINKEIKVQKCINTVSVNQRVNIYSSKHFSKNVEQNCNSKALVLKSKEIKTSSVENLFSEHQQKNAPYQDIDNRSLEDDRLISTCLYRKSRSTSCIMKPSFHSIPEEKEIGFSPSSSTKQKRFYACSC